MLPEDAAFLQALADSPEFAEAVAEFLRNDDEGSMTLQEVKQKYGLA